jgi:hypothetical protein
MHGIVVTEVQESATSSHHEGIYASSEILLNHHYVSDVVDSSETVGRGLR